MNDKIARGRKALELFENPETRMEGLALLKAEAESGNVHIMCDYGKLFNTPGAPVTQNKDEALYWYKTAADFGDDRGQFYMGLAYYNGDLVEQDYAKASMWFTLAGEKGYPLAQYYLGHMYFKGNGVPKDTAEAMRWFTLSVDRECNEARISLGDIFSNPKWPNRDYRYAYNLYKQAMDSGFPDGFYKIGMMHYNGVLVPVNFIQASKYFRSGAELDHAGCCYMMGKMYYLGEGVEKNMAYGRRYLEVAIQGGSIEASEFLERVDIENKEKKWSGSKSTLIPIEVLYTPDLLERPKEANLTRAQLSVENTEVKKRKFSFFRK